MSAGGRSGAILAQRKLVLTMALLLAALGLAFWLTMTRQEDPRMPDYWGMVTVTFPGADAETVERLVLQPVEDELAHVDEIGVIEGTANAEIAFVDVELRDDLDDTDAAWDRVRQALTDARPELPDGASEPMLDDRLQDQESIVYALAGHPDPLVLAAAAEELKDRLLAVHGVSDVNLIADPGEQITVELDDAEARHLGLPARAVVAQLAARSRILPGGSVAVAGRSVRLRPQSEFASLEEIRATPIRLPSGATVPLSAVARVRRGPEEPARAVMRADGETAVGLGVVPRRDVNLVDWGAEVRRRVAEVAPELAPVEVRELIYQPARVEARLSNLNRSLLTGALVVAGVLVLAMGLRLGLVVASVVPLVSLSSMAVYALGGGVLHQMSIAAVVIALGMLVDNAIVMAEAIQWRLDRGAAPAAAATASVRELAVPLAAATATTLAAFLPMLLADGVTARFTRAIPVVIMLTLTVSYLFAVFVTPALGALALRPRHRGDGGEDGGRDLFQRLAGRLSRLAVARPGRVLLAAGLVVALSFAVFPLVRQEFFPSSDRNQLVVDLELPEGSHLDATDAAARSLERLMLPRPEVTSVVSYVGRSAPHFYYNLSTVPWSPHFAQVVLETADLDGLEPAMEAVRRFAAVELPGAEVVVRKLEQGPSLAAPVEVRLYGRDLAGLHRGADQVMALLRQIPGAVDVRHDLSLGSPMLRFEVDDAAAARRGLSRPQVADALYGATRGLPVGQFRAGEDPVPVVVRSTAGERTSLAELPALDVAAAEGEPVPLAQVARLSADWRPGAIRHRDRRRTAAVLSQLEPGATYSDVTGALVPRLAELELPPGVEVEMGGAAESSGEANSAMLRTLPAGVLLLLGILMAEFRSFRRLAIVLVTVPLAAAGIVPGLLLGDQPFGFMSLLGVLALAGVVVNNAIVLLEVVETRRREGAAVAVAVADGIERRVRPILLTTATTVLGLLPLAVSPSTLWPPLAWTMISGLIASTLLTLLVVPALYLLLFRPGRVLPMPFLGRRRAAGTAAALALLVLLPGLAAAAQEAGQDPAAGTVPVRLTLEQAMERASERPRVVAGERRASAAGRLADAEQRAARWPTVATEAGVRQRDRALELETPIGSFDFGDRRSETAALTLIQPLVRADRQLYAAPAARREAAAAGLEAERLAQGAAATAAEAYLDVLAVDAALAATDAFLASLEARLEETAARVAAGRTLEAEALKVRLARDDARQDRRALVARRRVAALDLGRAVGVEAAVDPIPLPPVADGAPGNGGAGLHDGLRGRVSRGLPNFPAAVARALAARPDLAALEEQRTAAGLRRKAVRAERWPRLEATASYVWQGGSPYADDAWAEGGLRVTWSPFAAGTRAARAAAVAEERSALTAELAEARRGVEVALSAAYADLETALGALEVGESGVVQARETLRVERERHAAGRVTTNDLLEAEAALRRQRTRRDVAALDVVRAWVRAWTAMGETPPALQAPAAEPVPSPSSSPALSSGTVGR